MTRIELGHIPPRIIQCEACGRVKLYKAWMWADFIIPDVKGYCPTCLELIRAAQERRYERNMEGVRKRAARGQLKADLPVNPFEGFEGE